MHENTALSIFEDSLRLEELRVTVRAAARPTLSEAINLAAKQEVRVKRTRPIVPENAQRIIKEPEFGASRPEPTCFRFNAKDHYANECPKPAPNTRHWPANDRQTNSVCNYCKKPGHQIDKYKLREDNNAKRASRDKNTFRSQSNNGENNQRDNHRTYHVQHTRSPFANPRTFSPISADDPTRFSESPTMASGNYFTRDADAPFGSGVPYVNKPYNKLVLSFLPFDRTILLTIPLNISTYKACTRF